MLPSPPTKELEKVTECKYCRQARQVRLVRNITGSGSSQVYWQCKTCRRNAYGGGQYIDHKPIIAFGKPIENIPVIEDYRVEKCAVCGALGAEYHHWAPRHLFGDDADKWPGAYLCKQHHDLWHRLVTPLMSRAKARVRQQTDYTRTLHP